MRAALRVLVAAIALVLAACTPQEVRPSPSPSPSPTVAVASPTPTEAPATPSPSPSPSPEPTPQPTPQPTPEPPPPATPLPRPLPTTRDAGERIKPFYLELRQMFPVLPLTVEIMYDEPYWANEHATFRGLSVSGEPRFAVREDVVIDRSTAVHEIGHAYQVVIERSKPVHVDVLTMYWRFRGFPGTWQEAEANSKSQPSASAQWAFSPVESFAEAFRMAVTLETNERTLDYGKTIDPLKAREFFLSLMSLP